MSSITINGDTSGSVIIQAPAVAGSGTVNIPTAASGTMMVSGNMPAFSAYQSSSQSFSAGINTKVQFQTKEWDTASCFDNTTNYRYTPNVAGYYQVSGGIQNNAGASNWMEVVLYKNGAIYKNMYESYPTSTGSGGYGSCMVYLNGTTDYIEVYCKFQNNASGTTNINGIYFQGCLMRGA
jgi:hypothetical protein